MKNFIRRKEDFECERCGKKVVGDGYTDHCPNCLWGKHVDKEIPGDRASDCGGGMEAVELKVKSEKWKVRYVCLKCGHEFWVRAAKDDNREKLMELCGKR